MMENRFELRRLTVLQARAAVFEPAKKRNPERPIVSIETAEAIVRLVAGEPANVPLAEIDNVPPLLSLICEQLNARRLLAQRDVIEQADVVDVDHAARRIAVMDEADIGVRKKPVDIPAIRAARHVAHVGVLGALEQHRRGGVAPLVEGQPRHRRGLERDERDSGNLEHLFRLDHLATRMRRNAQSLLVLSGTEPVRQHAEPVAIGDVVRAALS